MQSHYPLGASTSPTHSKWNHSIGHPGLSQAIILPHSGPPQRQQNSFPAAATLSLDFDLAHRPQCHCLSLHVLAVPSFSTYGIITASIKLSDFRLLSSMNRRLLIKRSDLWSKSEGVIKLTTKRGLRSSQDFCQQSRLQRHSLSFFCWHATLPMVWARKPKVFPQKFFF